MANGFNAPSSKLLGWSYIGLGIGFLLTGINTLRAAAAVTVGVAGLNKLAKRTGLGETETLAGALRRAQGDGPPRVKKLTARTIEDRVRPIRVLALKGGRDPKIREQALAVLSRKCGAEWCTPAKNWQSEVDALYRAITDPRSPLAVRYTRDPRDVDTFTAARRTMALRGGDCDDQVIALGALLLAVGYDIRLIVMQAAGAKDWSHILLAVVPPSTGSDGGRSGSPPGGGWYVLDPTMPDKGPGWAPPGLLESMKFGRPVGITMKAKAFRV